MRRIWEITIGWCCVWDSSLSINFRYFLLHSLTSKLPNQLKKKLSKLRNLNSMASTQSSHLSTTSLILIILLLTIAPSYANNIMYGGDTLQAGQSLTQGNYQFIMQTDCNLVLYDTGSAVWSSGTDTRGTTCHVTLEMTGDLVINNVGSRIWSSDSGGKSGNYILVLQRDRNVVIYGTSAVWATNTVAPAKKWYVDGNVLYTIVHDCNLCVPWISITSY